MAPGSRYDALATRGAGHAHHSIHSFSTRLGDFRSVLPTMTSVGAAIRWMITALSMYATGIIGFALPNWGAHFPLPIIPGGIAAAAAYRWGRRMWSAVFLGGTAIQLSVSASRPLIPSLGVGAGLAAGALVSAWLLERSGFEPSFGRPKDALIFVFATAAGMTIAPTVGMAAFLVGGFHYDPMAVRWTRWWSNTEVGVLLVGPALIAMSRQSLTRFAEHWLEGAFWVLGVLTCCGVIALVPGPVGRSIIVMLALLVIVVGAIRFGLVVSSLGTIVIASVTACSFTFGFGLFGTFAEFAGRLTLFLFTATLVAASLVVTALLAERDAAAREKLRAEHRYAQIFDGSTQAIWVHDPVELDFLLVNEAAERQYGWTRDEFLARKVSALAPPGEPRILPTRKLGEPEEEGHAAPFETQHRTKDGRILDVEVWMRSIDLGGRPADLVFAIDVSERRTLGQALIDVLAGEQRRIAGEIHDGLGQELTGLALSLRALTTRAERNLEINPTDLDDLAKLATRCIEGSKRIVQGLSPLNDAGGSLAGALEALARRASLSGTRVSFHNNRGSPPSVKTDVLDHFYRIAQEAVQNALKHADATAIEIELSTDHSGVLLSITDDGRGLPSDIEAHRGLGMRTMHFRADAIGGTLAIETPNAGGTTVRCEVRQ